MGPFKNIQLKPLNLKAFGRTTALLTRRKLKPSVFGGVCKQKVKHIVFWRSTGFFYRIIDCARLLHQHGLGQVTHQQNKHGWQHRECLASGVTKKLSFVSQ